MPAAPYVFGSGYDQVAGQRFATDQMNIGIQREDAARRDAALQQQRAEWLAAQQQAAKYAQDQQQNTFNFGIQQQNRADKLTADAQTRSDVLAQNAATAATGAYQFGQTEADKAAERAFNEKYASQNQTEHKSEKADARAEIAYKDAFNLVDKGLITTPEQLDNLPDLLPQHKDILKAYVSKADLTNAVQEANATIAVDPTFKSVSTPYWTGTNWMFKTPDIEGAARQAVLKNPRIAAKLGQMIWNANTKQFVPSAYAFSGATANNNSMDYEMPLSGAPTPAPIPPTASTGNTGWTPPQSAPPVVISSFGSPAPYTPPLAPAWTPPVARSQVPAVTAPAAAPSTNRVRMLSPQGKIGSIPAQQLGDALANGYILAR